MAILVLVRTKLSLRFINDFSSYPCLERILLQQMDAGDYVLLQKTVFSLTGRPLSVLALRSLSSSAKYHWYFLREKTVRTRGRAVPLHGLLTIYICFVHCVYVYADDKAPH